MDALTLGLIGGISKSTAQKLVSVGIQSVSFVSPNVFRFVLANSSIQNVTISNFNEFTLALKNKLISLDDVLLNKFSVVGGKLLFDNSPLEGGSVDLTNYYNKLEVDNLLLNKVSVDGTKVLSTNDYTDIEKNKVASTETKANTIETNLNNHIADINNPHQVSMSKIVDNNITSPTDGQGLFYNSITSKWENKTTSTTDEKVKLTALSTSGDYLGNLIDNSTIQIFNNKIIAKSLDGQTVTLTELNYISGLDENIMTKFSNFVNGGIEVYSSGVFSTYADLLAFNFTTLSAGKTYLMYVATDINHDSHGTTYMCNNTTNNTTQLPYYSGLSSATQRVLSVDKVDLTNEVKNKLSQTNIDMTDIIKTTDLANYTKTTDLQTNYALKSDLTGKVNSSDIVDNLTSTDTTKPLSANQGSVIKGLIDGKPSVNDSATTSTTETYSIDKIISLLNTKQNKILISATEPIDKTLDNFWLDITSIPYKFFRSNGTSYSQIGSTSTGGTTINPWIASTSYNVNDLVIYNNGLYQCKTLNSDSVWTIGNWNLIGGGSVSAIELVDNTTGTPSTLTTGLKKLTIEGNATITEPIADEINLKIKDSIVPVATKTDLTLAIADTKALYIAKDTGLQYYYNGSTYIEIPKGTGGGGQFYTVTGQVLRNNSLNLNFDNETAQFFPPKLEKKVLGTVGNLDEWHFDTTTDYTYDNTLVNISNSLVSLKNPQSGHALPMTSATIAFFDSIASYFGIQYGTILPKNKSLTQVKIKRYSNNNIRFWVLYFEKSASKQYYIRFGALFNMPAGGTIGEQLNYKITDAISTFGSPITSNTNDYLMGWVSSITGYTGSTGSSMWVDTTMTRSAIESNVGEIDYALTGGNANIALNNLVTMNGNTTATGMSINLGFEYPKTNPNVRTITKNLLNYQQITGISFVNELKPTNTDIRYLMIINSVCKKYNPTTHTLDDVNIANLSTEGNISSDFVGITQTDLDMIQLACTDNTLSMVIGLMSTDGIYTPTLDDIKITYTKKDTWVQVSDLTLFPISVPQKPNSMYDHATVVNNSVSDEWLRLSVLCFNNMTYNMFTKFSTTGSSDIVADSQTTAITSVAGNGIKIEQDSTTKSISYSCLLSEWIAKAYKKDEYVTKDGILYRAKIDNTNIVFDLLEWDAIGGSSSGTLTLSLEEW